MELERNFKTVFWDGIDLDDRKCVVPLYRYSLVGVDICKWSLTFKIKVVIEPVKAQSEIEEYVVSFEQEATKENA